LRDKNQVKETKMSDAYIMTAKGMAETLLAWEHRGPGDTIEAAAHRLQTRLRVPASTLLRLRNRKVKDMLMSSFFPLAAAYAKYQTACQKMDSAYQEERARAIDPQILRLADFISGTKAETEEA
jgi:hypothetical protein